MSMPMPMPMPMPMRARVQLTTATKGTLTVTCAASILVRDLGHRVEALCAASCKGAQIRVSLVLNGGGSMPAHAHHAGSVRAGSRQNAAPTEGL